GRRGSGRATRGNARAPPRGRRRLARYAVVVVDDFPVVAGAGDPDPETCVQRLDAAKRHDLAAREPIDEAVLPRIDGRSRRAVVPQRSRPPDPPDPVLAD